jgi:putative lipase involved disintegration of autophagic bodies
VLIARYNAGVVSDVLKNCAAEKRNAAIFFSNAIICLADANYLYYPSYGLPVVVFSNPGLLQASKYADSIVAPAVEPHNIVPVS